MMRAHSALLPAVAHDPLSARPGAGAVDVVSLQPGAQVLAVNRGAMVAEARIRLPCQAGKYRDEPIRTKNSRPALFGHQSYAYRRVDLRRVLLVEVIVQPVLGAEHCVAEPALPVVVSQRYLVLLLPRVSAVMFLSYALSSQMMMRCCALHWEDIEGQVVGSAHVSAGVQRAARGQLIADLSYVRYQVLHRKSSSEMGLHECQGSLC